MAKVDVAPAAPHERGVLENLLQLYLHDFSEILAPEDPRGDLGEDGRFAYPFLDAYWGGDGRLALLVRVDGKIAGFALLDRNPHSGALVDRNMGEFFIVRKHRRSGFGAAAARAAFSQWPGQWEIAIMRGNAAALPFWRKAVTGHGLARDIQESDVSSSAWNGPIIRFLARPPG